MTRVLTNGEERIEGADWLEVLQRAYTYSSFVGNLQEHIDLIEDKDERQSIISKYDLEGKNKGKNLAFTEDGNDFEFFNAPSEILGNLEEMSRFVLENKFCKINKDWHLI